MTMAMRAARVLLARRLRSNSSFSHCKEVGRSKNTWITNSTNVHQSTTSFRYLSSQSTSVTQSHDDDDALDSQSQSSDINNRDSIDVVYNSPIGKMKHADLTKARQLLFFNARKKTKESAWNSEQILERLVAENRDG